MNEERRTGPTASSRDGDDKMLGLPEVVFISSASQQDDDNKLPAPVPSTAAAAVATLDQRSALWGWLVLCYSTGPTSSMATSYVGACIQSMANKVGHVPGSDEACATKGTISCVVHFGPREIDYLSYLLYLRSIGRALEGVVAILVAGAADYSNLRKPMMIGSIYVFGVLALPFAGLVSVSYGHLNAMAGLYCALTVIQGVYTVIEGSYVPIFMRSAGWLHRSQRLGGGMAEDARPDTQQDVAGARWIKGSRVSVLGLVSSNIGGITALLIGVILVYGRGSYRTKGYENYLLAVTIAGCMTIAVATIGNFLLPSVAGKPRPAGKSLVALPFENWLRLLRSLPRYPEAFKLCVGWILWNTGYTNFLGLLSSLFLEVAGITSGSSIYTVYSFTSVIFACMGSLSWMALFPRLSGLGRQGAPPLPARIKIWAYVFLGFNIFWVFWGCLGISTHVPIGFKHVPEFWVAQAVFMSTSSALRSFNRMLFSSLIPAGSEALFFGLEITLDLATGWINPLVQGVIQDRTHNLRYPMLPNLFLMIVALGLYVWVDVGRGIEHAKVPLGGEAQNE